MHWIKLLMEGWVLLGIVTVIVGVIWTNKQRNELSKPTTNLVGLGRTQGQSGGPISEKCGSFRAASSLY